jgi:hypothetical protein
MTNQIHWECRDITRDPLVPWDARRFEMVASLRRPGSITRLCVTSQFIGREAETLILQYARVAEERLRNVS